MKNLKTSTANISGTDEDNQNCPSASTTADSPAFGEVKVRWTLVHYLQRSRCGIIPTEIDFFRIPYFGP